MKICVFGTGGVGGSLAAMFSNAGHEVSCVARGEHLTALKEWGLQFSTPQLMQTIYAQYTDQISEISTPDVLFLCVKSFGLPDIEEQVSQLTGEHTLVVPVVNGLPWWHFMGGWQGELRDYVPRCLDPHGTLKKFMPIEQMLGAVVYTAASLTAPGKISNRKYPPRLYLGELDNSRSARLETLCAAAEAAEFKAPLTLDIRLEIWRKLCWNIAFNPISALTGLSAEDITERKEPREAAILVMRELEQVAQALGIGYTLDVEERMEVARSSGKYKPSMLQDAQNERRMEIEAIITAVIDVAGRINCPVPTLDKLHTAIIRKQKTYLPDIDVVL